MILSREQIDAVLRGETVQQRAAVKDGDELRDSGEHLYVYHIDDGWCGNEGPNPCYPGTVRYAVGKTYAAQMSHYDHSWPTVWLSPDGSIAPQTILTEDRHFYQVTTTSGRKYYLAQGYTPLRVCITAIRRDGGEWVLTLERAEMK